MRPYWALAKGSYLAWMVYRFSTLFTLVSNLLYMVVIYFLWRNIYSGAETLNGMTFNQAFVYLTLAGSIFNGLKTWVDWSMSRSIITGAIATDVVKPLDYQMQMLFRSAGTVLYNFTVISIPSAILLLVVFRAEITPGLGLLLFPLSLVFAFLINFVLDYAVGLTSFYTESLWGISMTKEIIVTLLSGALVPIQFFPEAGQAILRLLPFQAIYHIPLTMIVSPNLPAMDYLAMLGVQGFWAVLLFALSRLFYRRASQVLFINGG